MGGTHFDPNWLGFYALARGAQATYNWMTSSSPRSTRRYTRVLEVQPDVQVERKTERAGAEALVKGNKAASQQTLPSSRAYVPVNPQRQAFQPQSASSSGHTILPPHVLTAASQYLQRHPELNSTHQQVAMLSPSLLRKEYSDENRASRATNPLLQLTGRELTVRNPINAADLTTTAPAGEMNQKTDDVVGKSGFFRRHPNASAAGIIGGTPLLGAPFIMNGGSEAGSTSGDFFWNMYENASGAYGKAYNTASSAARFAWNNTGWTTKLGLGVAAVGLTYYLARRYLRSQATVHVENNFNPKFNPTVEQNIHFHFPEGTEIRQKKGKNGVHYTIKAERTKAERSKAEKNKTRECWQKAIRQVVAENKRAAAAAA